MEMGSGRRMRGAAGAWARDGGASGARQILPVSVSEKSVVFFSFLFSECDARGPPPQVDGSTTWGDGAGRLAHPDSEAGARAHAVLARARAHSHTNTHMFDFFQVKLKNFATVA